MLLLKFDKNKLILKSEKTNDLDRLSRQPRYKIRINRYVDSIKGNVLYFNNNLTIHEIKNIITTLNKISDELSVHEDVESYMSTREYYIEHRYRLGNDIKKRNSQMKFEFNAFSDVVNGVMVRPLTEQQLWNAFYMAIMKFSSNFSVPGSGKTATVLGTYVYLKSLEQIDKIIMIGPKNSFGSWIDEYKICFGIDEDDFYINIHDSDLSNTISRNEALRYNSGNKSLILINYESVDSLSNALMEIIDYKTLLVFDEIHKIKNPFGQRAHVCKEISVNAGSIIALTGTPIPNSYADIYNVLNILYKEDYKEFFGFSINELKRAQGKTVELINDKIKPFFCRISKEDLNVPPPNEDLIYRITASAEENQLFKIIFQTYKDNLFALIVRIFQLEVNPRLLLKNIQLGDFSFIIDDETDNTKEITVRDYSTDISGLVDKVEKTSKVKKLEKLLRSLLEDNKKVIVWCTFITSIKLIEEICNGMGIKAKCIYGEIDLGNRLSLIKDFRNGIFDVLITNPHTLAESVSLHTVCHDAIYFEYSYNLVHLLQSKDRIHRLGLEKDQYTQYYFLNNYYDYNEKDVSISDRIYERLKEKEETMLNAISDDVLEHVTSSIEDLNIIFQDLNLLE